MEGGTVVETGTPVTLTIDVANNAPVVSDLDITPNDNIRGKTAFEETTTVINSTTHTYSDPNNDAQDHSGTSYIWEHKRPWADNWISVKDGSNHSQTGESLDPAIIAQFFAKGSRYEGDDLRLRMTVKDDQGMKSADAVQMIYPVTDAPTTVVTMVEGGKPTPHAMNEEVYVSCVSDTPGASEDDASDTTTPSVENGDASSPDDES